DLLVEMTLRAGRAPGRNVEQEHVGEIAPPLEVHGGAPDAVARPDRSRNLEKIDAVILGDGKSFPGDPIEIRIHAVARLRLLARHGRPPSVVVQKFASFLPRVIQANFWTKRH